VSRIVGIHGIGQQFRGDYALRTAWLDAIRDGLVRAGYPAVAEGLESSDLRVAFFGDLFRPPGSMSVQGPPFGPADIQAGQERDLLSALFEGAVAQDPSLGVPRGAMGAGGQTVQLMLDRLTRTPALARVAQRAFIGNLKQVTAFLRDGTVKKDVLARLHASVGPGTRVLIGHSLGSVVAYEYLCQHKPASMELLVTLGSPLGIPNVIFEKLTPAPAAGAGAWPGSVAEWVNVSDPNDIVALRKDLAPLFRGPAGKAVSDRSVSNGDEPHAAERYLNARQTGSALGALLAAAR
jgi:hypothetical protein